MSIKRISICSAKTEFHLLHLKPRSQRHKFMGIFHRLSKEIHRREIWRIWHLGRRHRLWREMKAEIQRSWWIRVNSLSKNWTQERIQAVQHQCYVHPKRNSSEAIKGAFLLMQVLISQIVHLNDHWLNKKLWLKMIKVSQDIHLYSLKQQENTCKT